MKKCIFKNISLATILILSALFTVTSDSSFQSMGAGEQSSSGLVEGAGSDPPVNVTVSCYDINGEPLYLANTLVLDPVWHYGIHSGFTNSSGVFKAINLTLPETIDICVSWGNASAPGQPGYYMYFSGIDATSNVAFVVNASDLRAGGGLSNVTLTLQNSTGPMLDTRLYACFNATDGVGFPLGMGPITDSDGVVTLYLSNDTWAPEPTYYTYVVCQMSPSNNSILVLTSRLVSSDEESTITMPDSSEMATVDLAFSSPTNISLMDDIRLYFEFPGAAPPEIDRDDLALMYVPSKLHGEMLFAVPAGPGGVFWLPVADGGSTWLCINASMPFQIAAIYTNTTSVSGGPWLFTPMKMIAAVLAGETEIVSMGGDYLKLRSVTPVEAYLGSAPKLDANFTDEFYSPLTWIAGNGSTSYSTGFTGAFSNFAIYNLTIWYPNGTLWYDGQAMCQYGGAQLNGELSGIPSFPSLDTLGTYTYNISIDTGPWPLDPPGNTSIPLSGDFEVTEPPALATFSLDKNLNVWTEEDDLLSGNYMSNTNFGMGIHNVDDDSDTVLGDLEFYAEADDISGVGWQEHADWTSSYVNWTFPPDFVVHENEGFGTDFGIEQQEMVNLNLSLSRVMNETRFSSDGYQMANFTANFTNTDFLWCGGSIDAQEHWLVNASIVPGTFQTDAPLEGFNIDMHRVDFGLRKDEIQSGVDYNFSVIVKVELTGNEAPPILYKPGFGVSCEVYQESMSGGEVDVVDMPSGMLPDNVTVAQASTNTTNIWTLERRDHVQGTLGEVPKTLGARATFIISKNFGVWTEGDILMDGEYQLSPNYGLGIQNDDDDTDTVLGDLQFYAEADNITWVDWQDHADWTNSYANWTFPPDFIIHENEGFETKFELEQEQQEMVNLNLSLSRVMNQTRFSSDGYQMANFTANFTNTDFLGSWGNIEAQEHWMVNASIVPGTFQTDAPLEGFNIDMHRVDFNFRNDLMQAGVDYNFSVVIKVELTAGYAVVYKPHFHVGRELYFERVAGGEDYVAEMPSGMLPENVTTARVQTNSSNYWSFERRNHIYVDLNEFAATLDLSTFPSPFTDNTRILIPVSDPHGPCGAAHTMDTMGGVLIANRLGREGGTVTTAMDSYTYISTYDFGTAEVTMTDTTSNLIVLASPGVNQVAYYYNELSIAETRVLPVLFLRDGEGDYLYVQSSTNEYRIESDGNGKVTAEYGVIQIHRDGERCVLLVYGLGGESSMATAKVVSEFDQWSVTGHAVIVKYYDSNADGYLDTIEIVETVP